MSIRKWLQSNGYSDQQYGMARALLMTGPSATPPSFAAVRKMMARLRNPKEKPGPNGWRPWRAA